MKRLLLCAVATLIVGAVSAQPFANKGMKSKPRTVAVKAMQHQVEMATAPVAKSAAVVSKKRAMALDKKFVQSKVEVQAVNAIKRMGSRRAPEVQAEYMGSGNINNEGATWTMLSGVSEDGQTLLLADVIPNPYPTSIDYVVADYTLENNTVTIPAQAVFGSDKWTAFIFGVVNDDYSITMTLGEDGSLTLPDGEQILYGAFSGEKFDPTLETYLGYVETGKNIKYALPGQVVAPAVEYNPTGLYLHFGMSRSGYSYSNELGMIPCYTPLPLVNGTMDVADRWEWSIDELGSEDIIETQTGSERDFTPQIKAGTYSAAQLIGYNQDAASKPFVLGATYENEAAYLFAGTMQADWDMSDGTLPIVTLANGDNSIARYTSFATPDVNKDRSISTFVFYQAKPTAPLYMEGINMLVGNMTIKDPANFTLKCKVQKVTMGEDGWVVLGDVIAQADLTADNVIVGYTGQNNTAITELIWDEMYVEDEFGMSEPISFLNLDEEFAIVIEGWDNGTFSCDYIWGEYDCNMSAPYRTFYFKTGDEQTDDNLYRRSDGCCQLVGFVGAAYGYLYTEDNTNLTLPVEGGQAAVHVEPMFYANDDEGNPTTGLWLADDSDTPEWLQIDIANEVYTSEENSFDMVFAAEALPAGVTGREAHLVFEQWGSKLEVNVTQGEATGVSVTVKKVEKNTPAYNLAGQRVNSSYKGLVIKNGKKAVVK